MADRTAGDVSPTVSALMNARLSLTIKPVSETGKAIPTSVKADVVATLVERKTQYTVLTASKTKQAPQVRQRIEQVLATHRNRVHTITYDNGLEFAEHQKMVQTLSADIYPSIHREGTGGGLDCHASFTLL